MLRQSFLASLPLIFACGGNLYAQDTAASPPATKTESATPPKDKDWEAIGLSLRAVTIDSIGMSLHLPLDCDVKVEPLSDRRLMAEPKDKSWKMSIDIQRARDDEATAESLARGYGVKAATNTKTLKQNPPVPMTINGNAASQIVLQIPNAKDRADTWMHTVFNPAPRVFVVFSLECTSQGTDEPVRLYRAALESVSFLEPAKIAADRALAETAAEATFAALSESAIRGMLVEDRWYRVYSIEKDGKERQLAYYRVRESMGPRGEVNPDRSPAEYDPAERDEGVTVRLDARYLQAAGSVYDVQSISWSSFDRTQETWSVRSAMNLKLESGAFAAPQVSSLTGNTIGDLIDLVISDPGATPKRLTMKKPEKAYLPQAFRSFMYRAFKPYDAAAYGMLTFEPSVGKITYRVETIAPATEKDATADAADAKWVVRSRLTADSPENTLLLDVAGNILKITKPNGEVTVASSLQEIKRIWSEQNLPTGSLR